MEQTKRNHCVYDDEQYFLADLHEGHSNPNTQVYVQCDLAAEEHSSADKLEPGAKLIIRHLNKQFTK